MGAYDRCFRKGSWFSEHCAGLWSVREFPVRVRGAETTVWSLSAEWTDAFGTESVALAVSADGKAVFVRLPKGVRPEGEGMAARLAKGLERGAPYASSDPLLEARRMALFLAAPSGSAWEEASGALEPAVAAFLAGPWFDPAAMAVSASLGRPVTGAEHAWLAGNSRRIRAAAAFPFVLHFVLSGTPERAAALEKAIDVGEPLVRALRNRFGGVPASVVRALARFPAAHPGRCGDVSPTFSAEFRAEALSLIAHDLRPRRHEAYEFDRLAQLAWIVFADASDSRPSAAAVAAAVSLLWPKVRKHGGCTASPGEFAFLRQAYVAAEGFSPASARPSGRVGGRRLRLRTAQWALLAAFSRRRPEELSRRGRRLASEGARRTARAETYREFAAEALAYAAEVYGITYGGESK